MVLLFAFQFSQREIATAAAAATHEAPEAPHPKQSMLQMERQGHAVFVVVRPVHDKAKRLVNILRATLKDMKCPCVIYCSISLADNEFIAMRKVRNVVLQKVHIMTINGQRFLTMIRLWHCH